MDCAHTKEHTGPKNVAFVGSRVSLQVSLTTQEGVKPNDKQTDRREGIGRKE